MANETISFTLDGTSVGTAVTDSNGVATLTGVATSDAVGTDTGGVVATFAGDTSNAVQQWDGQPGRQPGRDDPGEYLGDGHRGRNGHLDGHTHLVRHGRRGLGRDGDIHARWDLRRYRRHNSSGVATLTGVATSDAVGTDTGGIAASFAGDSNDAASSGTGNLVVSQAATAINSVSGTASGGTASLTATLTSSVTGSGLSGQTVSFTLDGTSVGTATTDSSGVATLTGVATSDAVGTDTGGVVANFAGVTDYVASSGTGNLVVTS